MRLCAASLTWCSNTTSPDRIALKIWLSSSAPKGVYPCSISNSSTPSDHRSHPLSCPVPLIISGA
eukprot:4003436-Pyramimonas_sp.AAC.1